MQPLRVGIIGFGTVGAGTYEVLSTNREFIADRVGSEIVVKRIADLDLESDRGIGVAPGLLTRTPWRSSTILTSTWWWN